MRQIDRQTDRQTETGAKTNRNRDRWSSNRQTDRLRDILTSYSQAEKNINIKYQVIYYAFKYTKVFRKHVANDILISLIIIIIIRLTSKRYYNYAWQKRSIILQNKKNTDKSKGVIFPLTIGSDNLARFSEEEDTIRRRDIELKTLRSVLHQFRHQV